MLSRPDGPSGASHIRSRYVANGGRSIRRGGFSEQVELVVMDHDDNNVRRVELTQFDGLERREEVVSYGYSDRSDSL